MNVQSALAQLLDGHDLSRAEARAVMNEIMGGEATPAQIGGFLVALRLKGETPDEIAGCAEAMREHVLPVSPARNDLVDTAGTGGDGASTINISTAAALVAAAAGAGVAKHGNRAVSSASGSADQLDGPVCSHAYSDRSYSAVGKRSRTREARSEGGGGRRGEEVALVARLPCVGRTTKYSMPRG